MTNKELRENLVELLVQRCDMRDKGCIGCEEGYPQADECKMDKFGQVADHLLANGVTIQRWIPVTERLPEKNKLVLYFTPYDGEYEWDMGVVCFRNGRQFRIASGGATHWMYLPEPPKEET